MGKATILIVEDELVIAADLELRLRELGHTVCGKATSGEIAVALVEQHHPDLVMMDIVIQGELDGIDLAEIFQYKWGIPVVFLIAYADTNRLERAKLVYPFGYLFKPFQDRDLKITVDMVLYVAQVEAKRRKAEESLRESEQKYRMLFNHAPVAIYEVDYTTGKFTKVNSLICEYTGYTEDELLNMGSLNILTAESQLLYIERLEKINKGESVSTNPEFCLRNKDGSTRWVQLNIDFKRHKNVTTGATVVAHDITERKKAEQALRESEERYRLIANNTSDIVSSIPAGLFIYQFESPDRLILVSGNPEAERLTGIRVDEWKGREFNEIWPEAKKQGITDKYLSVIRTGRSVEIEDIYYSDQRLSGAFHIRAFVLPANRLGVAFENITERKQAEEKLQQSEERYRDVANAHAGMIWETDENFTVTHLSGRVHEILGYEPEEIIGKSLLFLIKPEDHQQVGAVMGRLSQERGPIKDIEYWCRNKDGRRVRILTNGIAFFASDGRFLGSRGTHLDVTETYWARRRRDLILQVHEMSSESDSAISAVLSEACAELTDSPMSFFGMVEPDESAMIAHVWSPQAMAECKIPNIPLRFPVKTAGVWADPIRRREPVIFNDYSDVQDKKGLPDGHVPITRYLGVPIIEGDKVIAVAGVANRATDYDQRHIMRLRLTTSIIAGFLATRSKERALRESDQRLKTFIDFTADWEYWLMPDGCHQYDSPSCEQITGFSVKEFHDDPDLTARIVYPEDREVFDAHRCASIANAEIEFRITRKDGDIRWIQHRCRPILKYNGTYIGTRVSNRDITESKKAREALQESEEKFRLLHEAAGVGIGYYTPEGIVISFNNVAAQYMGGRPEEFTGKSIHELFAPDQAELYLSRIQKAAASPHWQKYEDCVELPTGVMWVQSVFTRVINSNQQIVGVQIVSTDITETKRAEEEILRNSKRLRAMVEILQHRPENLQTFLDHALEKALELTGSQIGYIYFYDEDRQEFELNSWSKEVMKECLVANPQTTYQLEKTGIWGESVRQRKPLLVNEFQADNPLKKGYPEGHVNLTRFLTVPVLHNGRIVAVVGVANKASDYNETDTLELTLLMDSVWKSVENFKKEEALRESEERFRLTYSTNPDAINVNRLEDGLYVDINEGFTRLTGFTREDIIGKTSLEINIWHDQEDRKKLVQGLQQRGYYENLEAQLYKKDGGLTTALMSARVISLSGVPHIISITRDISERIMAEKEKEKLQAQLQQAQKMEAIGALAGGISHDFNNLLQAINGYTQLLLMEKSDSDPEYHSLIAVQNAGFRASELVRQLLLFSRKADSHKRPIELQREVEQAKKMLERTIPKMIQIEVHTGTRLWTINADSVQIEQMLLNLGTNAADAMPDGGKLLFEIENVILDDDYTRRHLNTQPGRYVLLSVTDTGEGMDKETMAKIFEPFFTTKEFGKGTGLGLASVYGIVKSHGGCIICYSEVGQGTTFKIYFPAIVQPELDETKKIETKPIPRGTETVLLVDDEEAIRGFAQQALMKFGYKVMTASTGEEALELYSSKSNKIDLIVMDLGMPGMGGHKCLKEMLKLNPQQKVIIASGYSINGQVKKSLETGAKGFVGKPYRLADLLNTVRAVLDEK